MAKKLLEKAKVAEAKKPEIIKDLNQCIIEVSSQSAQNPVSLLTKEKYKIWNCHKQVNTKEKYNPFPLEWVPFPLYLRRGFRSESEDVKKNRVKDLKV